MGSGNSAGYLLPSRLSSNRASSAGSTEQSDPYEGRGGPSAMENGWCSFPAMRNIARKKHAATRKNSVERARIRLHGSVCDQPKTELDRSNYRQNIPRLEGSRMPTYDHRARRRDLPDEQMPAVDEYEIWQASSRHADSDARVFAGRRFEVGQIW